MTKTLWTTFRILFILAIAVVAFGTFAPTNPTASPYLSTLANVAVSTAEACPCNNLACSGNVCTTQDFWGCCIQAGVCKSRSCF